MTKPRKKGQNSNQKHPKHTSGHWLLILPPAALALISTHREVASMLPSPAITTTTHTQPQATIPLTDMILTQDKDSPHSFATSTYKKNRQACSWGPLRRELARCRVGRVVFK